MKRTFIVFLGIICTSLCSVQAKSANNSNPSDSILARIDTLIQLNNYWLEHIELDISLKNRYKLYPTENIYTFLQLDTKTGLIKQVQWSLDGSPAKVGGEYIKILSSHSKKIMLCKTKKYY